MYNIIMSTKPDFFSTLTGAGTDQSYSRLHHQVKFSTVRCRHIYNTGTLNYTSYILRAFKTFNIQLTPRRSALAVAPENIPSSPANFALRLVHHRTFSVIILAYHSSARSNSALRRSISASSSDSRSERGLLEPISGSLSYIDYMGIYHKLKVTLLTRMFFHSGSNRCSCINCTNFTNIAVLLNPVSTTLSIWVGNAVDSSR